MGQALDKLTEAEADLRGLMQELKSDLSKGVKSNKYSSVKSKLVDLIILNRIFMVSSEYSYEEKLKQFDEFCVTLTATGFHFFEGYPELFTREELLESIQSTVAIAMYYLIAIEQRNRAGARTAQKYLSDESKLDKASVGPVFSVNSTPKTIADRVRLARKKKGWTQDELANAMGLQSRKTVQNLEAGNDGVTVGTVISALEALEIQEI